MYRRVGVTDERILETHTQTCLYTSKHMLIHSWLKMKQALSGSPIPILCKVGVLYSQKCFQRDKHLLFCADTHSSQQAHPGSAVASNLWQTAKYENSPTILIFREK